VHNPWGQAGSIYKDVYVCMIYVYVHVCVCVWKCIAKGSGCDLIQGIVQVVYTYMCIVYVCARVCSSALHRVMSLWFW